ncbi:hypothetical protein BH10CHL1_BH10CHL1_07860 [soil metagenome]
MGDPTYLPSDSLIPDRWRQHEAVDSFRIYNPAIVRFRGRLLMAYRVDSGQRASFRRRIGLCELDEQRNVVRGSVIPFSDTIRSGDPRHYDPRFLVYQDRLFIHYNNNFQTRPNQLFMVELDPDTLAARSPARPLHLIGPRQVIEKNWMLFEYDGDLFAVYQIAPHTILRVNLRGQGAIECKPAYTIPWDVSAYAQQYGSPSGGAPPVRQGDRYVSFFHSKRPLSRLRWMMRYWPVSPWTPLPRYVMAIERRLREPFAQVRYYAGVYTFAAAPPFRPIWMAQTPVLRPEDQPRRQQPIRANPCADGIVYPCGAVPGAAQSWVISYGLHDERGCLRSVHLPNKAEHGL